MKKKLNKVSEELNKQAFDDLLKDAKKMGLDDKTRAEVKNLLGAEEV